MVLRAEPVDTFQNALGRLIEGIERTSADANTAVTGMMEKTTDVHEAMIALQREELTLQLAADSQQVRVHIPRHHADADLTQGNESGRSRRLSRTTS